MRIGQQQQRKERPFSVLLNDDDALAQIGFLADNLFFRLIQESPVHIVRNRSRPASLLTPGTIGCLLTHSVLQNCRNSSNDNVGDDRDGAAVTNRLKIELQRDFGIRSNKINDDVWTGISLARWTELLLVMPFGLKSFRGANGDGSMQQQRQRQQKLSYHRSLISALWLTALWGLSPTNKTLSGYCGALKRSGIPITKKK